ncbi:MAG: phosphatidate cytidylyltransferase [Bdellovibrio sp.]|nr:phosphatidate cytidylyltransferase [Bdellovibrio sp.]
MSNTSMRFISAAILILIVGLSFMLGPWAALAIILLLGVLVLDEIETNFLKHNRGVIYYFSQAVLISGFICFFHLYTPAIVSGFLIGLLLLNLFLLYYLFFTGMENGPFLKMGKIPFLGLLYTLLNFINLGLLVKNDHWIPLLILVMLLAYGMDTGAWFFGRKFGKTKLWPSVSPKKTREGLYGGMLVAGIIGAVYYAINFDSFSPLLVIIFALLGLISQLGDLVQSKFKRQANIKDSSALIPGHGGVYDRVDSLIFVVPFYLIWIQWWW